MPAFVGGPGVFIIAALFGGYPLIDAPPQRIVELGVDRLQPKHQDRDIRTSNLHLYLRQKRYEPWNLTLKVGATATRATGTITQLEGEFEQGSLRSQMYQSPGWGVGPAVEARFELLKGQRAALNFDIDSALLFYDRDFPAGGARYNGMFQAGPSVTYAPSPGHSITLGYRWTHTSNGQGLGAHNPAYNARGVMLQYAVPF